MNTTRAEEWKTLAAATADLEQGIPTVQKTLTGLRNYRSQSPQEIWWCSGELRLQGQDVKYKDQECWQKQTSQRHMSCSSKSKKVLVRTQKVFHQTNSVYSSQQSTWHFASRSRDDMQIFVKTVIGRKAARAPKNIVGLQHPEAKYVAPCASLAKQREDLCRHVDWQDSHAGRRGV